MEGKRKILKIVLMLDIVVVVYVLLTSTIIFIKSEEKVSDAIIEYVKFWSLNKFGTYQYVNNREKEKFTEIDYDLAQRLSGKILIQSESRGELWYVYPKDKKKYFLGRAEETARIIKKLSSDITNDEVVEYVYFKKSFPDELLGRFLIDINEQETYYINPDSRQAILLKNPKIALSLLSENSTGISNEDIRKLEIGEIDW